MPTNTTASRITELVKCTESINIACSDCSHINSAKVLLENHGCNCGIIWDDDEILGLRSLITRVYLMMIHDDIAGIQNLLEYYPWALWHY